MTDRKEQNRLAQQLYAADPARKTGEYDDGTCWLAACVAAYALASGDYTGHGKRLPREFILDYYGAEACQ